MKYEVPTLDEIAPVHGHEDEGEDGDVGGGDDDGLVELAPHLAKVPKQCRYQMVLLTANNVPDGGEGVVRRGEGDAEHQEQEVRHLGCTIIIIIRNYGVSQKKMIRWPYIL